MQYGPSHRLLISGQNFNCGFACIAHLLQEQLELPTLPPVFDEGPYQALLEAFRTVYQDPSLDWNDIKQSLDHYSHPGDKGMVWSLPLRHYLKNKLLSHTQYRDDLFSEFQALVDALLEGCTLSECRTDYSNLIDSNLAYL